MASSPGSWLVVFGVLILGVSQGLAQQYGPYPMQYYAPAPQQYQQQYQPLFANPGQAPQYAPAEPRAWNAPTEVGPQYETMDLEEQPYQQPPAQQQPLDNSEDPITVGPSSERDDYDFYKNAFGGASQAQLDEVVPRQNQVQLNEQAPSEEAAAEADRVLEQMARRPVLNIGPFETDLGEHSPGKIDWGWHDPDEDNNRPDVQQAPLVEVDAPPGDGVAVTRNRRLAREQAAREKAEYEAMLESQKESNLQKLLTDRRAQEIAVWHINQAKAARAARRRQQAIEDGLSGHSSNPDPNGLTDGWHNGVYMGPNSAQQAAGSDRDYAMEQAALASRQVLARNALRRQEILERERKDNAENAELQSEHAVQNAAAKRKREADLREQQDEFTQLTKQRQAEMRREELKQRRINEADQLGLAGKPTSGEMVPEQDQRELVGGWVNGQLVPGGPGAAAQYGEMTREQEQQVAMAAAHAANLQKTLLKQEELVRKQRDEAIYQSTKTADEKMAARKAREVLQQQRAILMAEQRQQQANLQRQQQLAQQHGRLTAGQQPGAQMQNGLSGGMFGGMGANGGMVGGLIGGVNGGYYPNQHNIGGQYGSSTGYNINGYYSNQNNMGGQYGSSSGYNTNGPHYGFLYHSLGLENPLASRFQRRPSLWQNKYQHNLQQSAANQNQLMEMQANIRQAHYATQQQQWQKAGIPQPIGYQAPRSSYTLPDFSYLYQSLRQPDPLATRWTATPPGTSWGLPAPATAPLPQVNYAIPQFHMATVPSAQYASYSSQPTVPSSGGLYNQYDNTAAYSGIGQAGSMPAYQTAEPLREAQQAYPLPGALRGTPPRSSSALQSMGASLGQAVMDGDDHNSNFLFERDTEVPSDDGYRAPRRAFSDVLQSVKSIDTKMLDPYGDGDAI